MEIIAFVLPFIVAIFLLFFFRKETTWWEYILLIVPSILVFFITKLVMVSVNTSDVEYLGDYITKVRHYDEWDEWIHRRCTRTYKSGKTTVTQTYDCSYRKYHPERWSYFDQDGNEHWLFYKEEYDLIRKRFKTPEHFIDMKRKYYRIDGDAQEYLWNGTESTIYTVTHENSYVNKIQASRSVFNFTKITDEEAETLGLYKYPEIVNYDQTPILSKNFSVSTKQEYAIRYINGFYGKKYQFRIYFLLFPYENGIEISELQRSYWVGGNKNELIVCLGMKDSTHIGWCNAFSWCDSPKLELKTEQYFNEKDSLDLIAYSDTLKHLLLNGEWERKEFEDFNYIKPELTSTQYIIMLIILLLYNIGISIFIILNDIKNVWSK